MLLPLVAWSFNRNNTTQVSDPVRTEKRYKTFPLHVHLAFWMINTWAWECDNFLTYRLRTSSLATNLHKLRIKNCTFIIKIETGATNTLELITVTVSCSFFRDSAPLRLRAPPTPNAISLSYFSSDNKIQLSTPFANFFNIAILIAVVFNNCRHNYRGVYYVSEPKKYSSPHRQQKRKIESGKIPRFHLSQKFSFSF